MGKTLHLRWRRDSYSSSACLLGYGALSVIGSTAPTGSQNWLTLGLGIAVMSAFFFLQVGAGLVYDRPARTKNRKDTAQQRDNESGFARSDQDRRSQMQRMRWNPERQGYNTCEWRTDGQLPILSHHLSND